MYRNTRFGDLMKGLSRGKFEMIVSQHEADKHSKGFRCWDQLLAMVYGHLTGSRSLRELEASFNQNEAHHYHLGTRTIKRTTLSDANTKRSCEVFAQTCGLLLGQANRTLKKELTDLLYLIDATPIGLKGLGYDDWAQDKRSNRTQGLKVHVMIESGEQLPVQAMISEANVNDIDMGRQMAIEAGAKYVFDKGYCDYNWWYRLHQQGATFVTRFKKNAGIETVKTRAIPPELEDEILEDAVVRFKNRHPGGKRINHYYGTPLRKVVINRPDKATALVLVTNDFSSNAQAIGEAYKKRWGIELFFKWLKQNLKIKQFLGRSENAVKIQIYTALIAYLLTYLYRNKHARDSTLKMCLVVLKTGLFQRPVVEQSVFNLQRRQRKRLGLMQGVLEF